jgi:hypothetical protein|tara:strand:- start:226 stop:747 length:522 start_codon:yes stop_codon:yes gene_type:complete
MRLLTYVLVALACLPATFAQKFYELEPINYSKSEAEDAIADYFSNPENLEAWKSEGDKGYLTNFLEAFNIPTASQVLVFSKTFAARGPRDAQDRSLFELQMNGRMLRYPFSYLIYSDTFNNMPPEALNYLWAEIERILEPTERREGYEGLSRRNKIAIKEILLETHPSAKKYW